MNSKLNKIMILVFIIAIMVSVQFGWLLWQ